MTTDGQPVTPDRQAPDRPSPRATAEPSPDAGSVTGPPAEPPEAAAQPPIDPRVEDALSRLTELADLPLAEQVGVFADIHQRLEGVLADPDSRG